MGGFWTGLRLGRLGNIFDVANREFLGRTRIGNFSGSIFLRAYGKKAVSFVNAGQKMSQLMLVAPDILVTESVKDVQYNGETARVAVFVMI